MRAVHWRCAAISARFNPRPALRPGDADGATAKTFYTDPFQSAPGLEAGRCAGETASALANALVSIRARP